MLYLVIMKSSLDYIIEIAHAECKKKYDITFARVRKILKREEVLTNGEASDSCKTHSRG